MSDFAASGAQPLQPEVRTYQVRCRHGSFVPIPDSCSAINRANKWPDNLLDHLVGELLEMQGHVEAERLGGLQIDRQLEFGRLHHRPASRPAWHP